MQEYSRSLNNLELETALREKVREAVRSINKAHAKRVASFYEKIESLRAFGKALDKLGRKAAKIAEDRKKEDNHEI